MFQTLNLTLTGWSSSTSCNRFDCSLMHRWDRCGWHGNPVQCLYWHLLWVREMRWAPWAREWANVLVMGKAQCVWIKMVMVTKQATGYTSIDHNIAHIMLPFLHTACYSSRGGVTSMHWQIDIMYICFLFLRPQDMTCWSHGTRWCHYWSQHSRPVSLCPLLPSWIFPLTVT